MNRFIQLHYLTVYPPSNPNRDDQGRPKSATFGGQPRLRISSQSIKRAARTSDIMQTALKGHMGERTQRIGEVIEDVLRDGGANAEAARKVAKKIADVFGTLDTKAEKEGHVHTKELAFISPQERKFATELAQKEIAGDQMPSNAELKEMVLLPADGAADIAMFGRMLAKYPDSNREAAVQVSHAITTHRALVEDDFYTAVDDLKTASEDAGAVFLDDAGFGSGVYYLYACIDVLLLIKNLDGEKELASRAAGALVEALAISTPSGKRSSFAHQTRAGFIRAELGAQQPRSLAGAFFKPVEGELMAQSISVLEEMAAKMDNAYGACSDVQEIMNLEKGEGSLTAIKQFVLNAVLND